MSKYSIVQKSKKAGWMRICPIDRSLEAAPVIEKFHSPKLDIFVFSLLDIK